MFNRDLEQALATSEGVPVSSDKPIIGCSPSPSPSPSQQEPPQPAEEASLDESDYKLSDSDEDFEPSPVRKSTEGKKAKNIKPPSKKASKSDVKLADMKVAPKSATTISCDSQLSESSTKSSDLPGSKLGLQATTTTPVRKRGVAKWVPPARVEGNAGYTKTSFGPARGVPMIRLGLSRKAPIKSLHSPLRTKN